jgi:quinolinate synthase
VIEAADFTGLDRRHDQLRQGQPSAEGRAGDGMLDVVERSAEVPDVEFVRPCNLCPHMKRISLENIRDSLLYMQHEVTVDPAIAERARGAVERMVKLFS